ncbi:hypothetical protein [Glaciimonas sp. PAMC28666]|uniref:hypothetical protein n=1 Tax=Glaciimonas sp. PAMC28666 TaxID=2807626 RepID=UPI00196639FC|nr:hypothetical protein [Glaciimonas sp. PAMC28666]QRX81824.1 hypothetical protein JQN73_17000 [Glaciimonas sp. PAMC28666]
MRIEGKVIRALTKILAFTGRHPIIRFTFDATDMVPETWTKLGFNETLEQNQTLIPAGIAKVSAFNARGKETVRRDLPKVPMSYPSFRTWKDWHGKEHSGIQYRTMDIYPREYVQAPSEFFLVLGHDRDMRICTREINMLVESEESVLHLANLMLECFGVFEIIDANTGVKIGTKLKNLQWEILPAGQYPWRKAGPIVANNTKSLDDSGKELIRYRMSTIAGFQPGFLAIGKGGFNAYFVYGFEDKGIYLLESGYLNNATYVFKQDWEKLSQLTKNEIINGELPHIRIIHDRHWLRNVGRTIRSA